MLNKQLIFDTVVQKLKTQGEASMEAGSCVYLAANGYKCAYGHLMDPKQYSTAFEDSSLTVAESCITQRLLAALDPIYGTAETNADRDFLAEIQLKLHDELDEEHFVDELINAAVVFAKKYGLTETPSHA